MIAVIGLVVAAVIITAAYFYFLRIKKEPPKPVDDAEAVVRVADVIPLKPTQPGPQEAPQKPEGVQDRMFPGTRAPYNPAPSTPAEPLPIAWGRYGVYALDGVLPFDNSGNLARFNINAGDSMSYTWVGDGTPATFQVSAGSSDAQGFTFWIDDGVRKVCQGDADRLDFDDTNGAHTITVKSHNGGKYNLQVNFQAPKPELAPGATRR